MKIPGISYLKKLLPKSSGKRTKYITSVDIAWWGVLGLFVVLLATIAWDAYFFYSRIVVKPTEDVAVRRQLNVTEEDIDEILRVLDERQQKFDEVLGQ